MSDFLARLAARAIGGEATLAPRLPSLFESAPHAAILPTVDDDTAATPRRSAVTANDALPPAAPLRPPHAPAPLPVDAQRTAPVEPPATRLPAPAVTSVPDRAMPATARAVPPAPPATAPIAPLARVSPAQPAHAEQATAAPIPPRQTRTAPPRLEAMSPPSGSLLAPSAPVFATPRVVPERARADRTATPNPRAAQAAGRAAAASEPVVHVSIGRIEVRAAPTVSAPARRRDQPQPSSLDDYLRQRGGKALP